MAATRSISYRIQAVNICRTARHRLQCILYQYDYNIKSRHICVLFINNVGFCPPKIQRAAVSRHGALLNQSVKKRGFKQQVLCALQVRPEYRRGELGILAFAGGNNLAVLINGIQFCRYLLFPEKRSDIPIHIGMHLVYKGKQSLVIAGVIQRKVQFQV